MIEEDHIHAIGEKINLHSSIYDKSVIQQFLNA